MSAYDTIRAKRAIRKFLPQPLQPDEIRAILNAGRLAQSSRNMQAWHFIAITNGDILQALSQTGTYAGHLAGAAFAVAIITPDPDARFNVMFDAGQAAAYMQLAAWELGIGSCLATIYEHDRAREILQFPDDMHIRIAISFGYPAPREPQPPRKGARRPLAEIVHAERWNPDMPHHNPFR
jgi:nitroreductase